MLCLKKKKRFKRKLRTTASLANMSKYFKTLKIIRKVQMIFSNFLKKKFSLTDNT